MESLRQQGTVQIAESIFRTEKVKKAIFTAQSIVSGTDFTYKIKKSTFKDKLYTHVYVETGYMTFKHLGFFSNGFIWKAGKKVETPSALAIAWIFRTLELNNVEKVDTNVKFFHTGKCCKCGKPLTDATSIQIGLGPKCRHS